MIIIGRHHGWRKVARSSLLGAKVIFRLTILRAVSPRPLPLPFPFLPPFALPLPLPFPFLVLPKALACLAGLRCRSVVLSITSAGSGEAVRLVGGSPGGLSHAMDGKGLGEAQRLGSYLTMSGFSSKEVCFAGGVGSRASIPTGWAMPSLCAAAFFLAVLRLAARPVGSKVPRPGLRLVALWLGEWGDVRTL